VILADDAVAGRFTLGTLPFALPQAECDNDGNCDGAEPPEFWPSQAVPAEGLFHLPVAGSF
jgi:hypothetical protein